jgi:hypothetical protein
MNTKLKVLNCNVNIYFNRTCLDQNLIPKYAQIKIRSHNKTITRQTETQAAKLRMKNEIKFLYSKKQHLNKTLCKLHLENAKQWGQLWNIIHNNITEKVEMRMRAKYTNLNNKDIYKM